MTRLVLLLATFLPLFALAARRRAALAWLKRNTLEAKAFACLLLAYGLIIWQSFLNPSGLVHDNNSYHYPLFLFVLTSLRHFGSFPLWNPYMSHGLPSIVLGNNFYLFLADRIPFYFLSAFSPWLPNSLLLYKASIVFHCLVFTGFMFLFLQEILPSRMALFWGTSMALFSGVTTGTLCQEQMAASILFVPLLLFLAIRLYKTRRLVYALLFGAFLGHSLCNHYPHLIAYLVFIFSAAFAITEPTALKNLLRDRMFCVKAFIIILSATLCMMAVPIYAYLEYASRLTSPFRGNQLSMSYDFIMHTQENSLNPDTLLTYVLFPYVKLERWGHGNIGWDKSPFYVGLMGLFFFFYGCIYWKNRDKRFWLASLLGILLFALGRYSFVYALLYRFIPLARLQRIPLHMANYMNLPIIVLSSFGFNGFVLNIREKLGRQRSLFSKRIMASTAIIALVLLCQFVDMGMFLHAVAAIDNGGRPEVLPLTQLKRPLFGPHNVSDAYWGRIGPISQMLAFKDMAGSHNGDWSDTDQLTFDPEGAPANHPQMRLLEHTMDLLKIETESSAPIRLLWQMNFDKYWNVYIDQEPATTQETQNGRMAVHLPAGRHVVLWAYEPMFQKILIHADILCCGIAFALLLYVI